MTYPLAEPAKTISPATRERLAKLLAEYRRKPDALLTALYLVQAECNCLSDEVLTELADILEMPKSVSWSWLRANAMKLAGLLSQWLTRAACACAAPESAGSMSCIEESSERRRLIRLLSGLSPSGVRGVSGTDGRTGIGAASSRRGRRC